MMNKKDLLDFKEGFIYSMIKNGIEKKDLKKVLLGEEDYAMYFLPISSSTDANLVITALHLLIAEDKITNQEINNTFNSIKINEQNVCLLLDYILSYLLYRKVENELELKYKAILELKYEATFEKIITNEEKYKNLTCYNRLLSLIYNALKE